MKLNMHIHTNHSDGKYSVKKVIDIMSEHNISIVAITDHDRFTAIDEAKQYAKAVGIDIINGMEVSAKNDGEIDFFDSSHSLHILAYFFDMEKVKEYYRTNNLQKNKMAIKLVSRLIEDGYLLGNLASEAKLSTTRIGEALVERGYEKNLDNAFVNILDKNYQMYRVKSITISSAIEMIHLCGGKAVLAHPFELTGFMRKISISDPQVNKIVEKLVSLGLDGIEAYYPRYNYNQIKILEKLAKKYNLFKTVGSDFHGKAEDDFELLDKCCSDDSRLLSLISNHLNKKGRW